MSEQREQFGLEGVAGVTGDAHRGDFVSLRVQRVAWSAAIAGRLREVGERLWVLGPIALVMIGLDAALGLPAWIRVCLDAVLIAMALRVVVGLVWPGRAVRMTAMHAARLIEERLGVRDNAIINALQLRTALVSGDGLTAVLAERVVDHGVEVSKRIEETRVVDVRGVAGAWGKVAAAGLVVVLSLFVMPRVWAAGSLRYLDPFGGHAPWSPTVFAIDVSPREVLVGDDAMVSVRLSGVIPQGVELVFVDAEGRELDRAGMGAIFERPAEGEAESGEPALARRYEMALHDLRTPVRFYPLAETGRGRMVEILPLDKPRVVSATLVVRPPSYTGLSATTERIDVGVARTRRVLVGSEIELTVIGTVDVGEVDRSVATVTGEIDVLGTSARQRVVAMEAGRETLSLRLVSRSGLRADDSAHVELEVVEDAAPRVSVRAPAAAGERAAVLAGRGVPVRATVEDDVRVEGLDVEWRVVRLEGQQGAEATRSPLGVARRTRVRWEGELALDSASMGARPGDSIEVWVEGRDGRGDEFGGAQITRVGPILVEVIDEHEFQRRALARLGIDDIVGPYEDIARNAEELAGLARDAAEASARAQQGKGSEQEADAASEATRSKRDALEREVRKRLGNEALVDYDQEMRSALETLLDRLEGFEEAEGDEAATEAERAERNAERLDLAAREAEQDLAAPAERLRLAAEMRHELDRLDRIAKAQRALADRLAEIEQLDDEEGSRLANEQLGLMVEADRVCARLDELGDAAAHELPGVDELAGSELELAAARRQAQESIEVARRIAGGPAMSLSDELVRETMQEAADLALTDLYFSTDPALDSVRELGRVVEGGGTRVDEPGVGEASEQTREEILRALEAVEQIEGLLEEVRERVRSYGIRKTAQAGPRLPFGALLAAILVGVAGDGADAGPGDGEQIDLESGSVDERFVRALEVARVRLGALKVRLREASDAAGPRLPVMGESAIDLAERVETGEVAETMYDTEWALAERDLTAARERAALAADRLEALYEESGSGEGECPATQDTALTLTKPGSSQSQGSSGKSDQANSGGGSSGAAAGSGAGQGQGGGLPNALDVLSQSAGNGQEERAGGKGKEGGQSGAGESEDPTDRGGFERAGTLPKGGSGQSKGEGKGDSNTGAGEGSSDTESREGNGEGEGGGSDPGLVDRARRFNERLYSDPVEIDRPVEGDGSEDGARIDADAIRLEGDPVGREAGLRGLLARSGMDAAEVEAVFERVPPAYRDVVASYLLRIAKDEASTSGGSPQEIER